MEQCAPFRLNSAANNWHNVPSTENDELADFSSNDYKITIGVGFFILNS